MWLPKRLVKLYNSWREASIYGSVYVESLLVNQGLLLRRELKGDLVGSGFKIFSQYNEDGIIQAILRSIRVPIVQEFVEIGIQDYSESNTRFLLQGCGWRGTVIDGSKKLLDRLEQSRISWRFGPNIVHSWVTMYNVNTIIPAGSQASLISIDIDGNDIWLIKGLEHRPIILISEFNPVFGAAAKIATPYSDGFDRFHYHESGQCYGCSISALAEVCNSKGYKLVAISSGLNNAFFVREDYNTLPCLEPSEVDLSNPISNDTRSKQGDILSGSSLAERIKMIEDCLVFDFDSESLVRVKDCV